MTANGLTTMFLGEKKNRTSKAALLNLSFSRAACLPFAIILLCGRVETNSINPVSQGKVTGQKPCIHAGLSRFDGYSHSIVSGRLTVESWKHAPQAGRRPFFDYFRCSSASISSSISSTSSFRNMSRKPTTSRAQESQMVRMPNWVMPQPPRPAPRAKNRMMAK